MTPGPLLDPALLRAEGSDETKALNAAIVQALSATPDWWQLGAAATREARRQGRGPFPLAPRSERARTVLVDGPGGKVPLRILAPAAPRGVYLHIHGGGWVLGAADLQDPALERIARETGLVAASVDYRLAPEHPYPAGPDDCEAAALWLLANGRREFGADALTIGGESAGGHLSAVTLLRLRDRHGFSGVAGANLVFGAFDLSMSPSARRFGDERLVLRTSDIEHFTDAFLPGGVDRRAPDVSPLYADLRGLPPALFTIGTRDALLDDSLFMAARWAAAGNETELALYPGGAHGFTGFPGALAAAANARSDAFLARVVARRSAAPGR